nr:LacI family DNA-binding transcriptional regulator [Xylanimonas cellulosilytica]
MQDVAARAGVSVKTVSNVVNDYPYIRPATRARVEEAIAALGYQVNVAARNLRQGRTGMIGLALPELRVPYFAELADSVMRAAEAQGLVLLIEQTGSVGEHEAEVLHGPRRRFTDGLLFSPVAMDPRDHPELDVDYPLVLLGERVFDAGVDHVTMANVEGARAATSHLVERGCRHIAVIGVHPGEAMGSAALRFDGYLQAVRAAGREFNPRHAGVAQRWVRSTGAVAMAQVLDSGVPVDGVFAMNDALALGALHVLHSRGLRVPDDVAVIGFDNIDDTEYSEPPLSSIDPGREQIADQAVGLLVARIAGSTAPPRQVVADFALVERESTAPV